MTTGETGPYYRSTGREKEILRGAFERRLPVLLKGPTGCGKSRLVEWIAHETKRPLVTVACNDETSATDLLGRWIVRGAETVWQDGPATRAARSGAILYLDEVAEAREDVLVVLHPLADHRRELFLDRRDETVRAATDFQLIASFNPGYRRGPKDLKPSTRQRFVSLAMSYPEAAIEAEIVVAETGVDGAVARRLVALAQKIRGLTEVGLTETASTRLLVAAAALIRSGIAPRVAARAAIVEPLTDDVGTTQALADLCDLAF